MRKALTLLVFLGLSTFACAASYTIDFEQYAGYTQIDNQYAADGVAFQNALQLVAPGYDYFDFPPHSGNGVITNDPNDPIIISFASGAQKVSGWYSDPYGVTVNAYNASNQLIGTFNGAAISGANAQFTASSTLAGGYISYITISDNQGLSDDETVDDVFFAVPLPSTMSLLVCPGIFGAYAMRRRKGGLLKA
jgi:hypothetical protein